MSIINYVLYNTKISVMQKISRKLLQKFKKFRKNKNSNLNIFMVCCAVILIWRGVRNIMDLYIFPNNPLVSCITCIILWILILLMDDGKIDELE